jgi:hypothetical protein
MPGHPKLSKTNLHTSSRSRIYRRMSFAHINPAVTNPSRPHLSADSCYHPCPYPAFQYPTSNQSCFQSTTHSRSINVPLITLQTPRLPLLPNLHTAFTTQLFPTTPRTLARTNKTRPFRTRSTCEVVFQILLPLRRVVADMAGA